MQNLKRLLSKNTSQNNIINTSVNTKNKYLLYLLLGSHAAMANPSNNSPTFQHHFNPKTSLLINSQTNNINNVTSHNIYVIILKLFSTLNTFPLLFFFKTKICFYHFWHSPMFLSRGESNGCPGSGHTIH